MAVKSLLKNKLNVSRWFTGPPLLKVSIKKLFKEELNSACWIKDTAVAHGGFSMTSIGISKNLRYNYSPRSVNVLHLPVYDAFPDMSPHTPFSGKGSVERPETVVCPPHWSRSSHQV